MTKPTRVRVVNTETGALEVGWVQRADPVFGDDLWLLRAPWWGEGAVMPGPVLRGWPSSPVPQEGSTWWLWQQAVAGAVRIMSGSWAPDGTGGVYSFADGDGGGVELTPERLAVIHGTEPE